jgi:hypothetical protein
LQRFSTAYYPPASLSYIPSILREIIEINLISLSAEIARSMAGLLSHTMIYDYSIYHNYALESLAILSSSIAIASKRLRTI